MGTQCTAPAKADGEEPADELILNEAANAKHDDIQIAAHRESGDLGRRECATEPGTLLAAPLGEAAAESKVEATAESDEERKKRLEEELKAKLERALVEPAKKLKELYKGTLVRVMKSSTLRGTPIPLLTSEVWSRELRGQDVARTMGEELEKKWLKDDNLVAGKFGYVIGVERTQKPPHQSHALAIELLGYSQPKNTIFLHLLDPQPISAQDVIEDVSETFWIGMRLEAWVPRPQYCRERNIQKIQNLESIWKDTPWFYQHITPGKKIGEDDRGAWMWCTVTSLKPWRLGWEGDSKYDPPDPASEVRIPATGRVDPSELQPGEYVRILHTVEASQKWQNGIGKVVKVEEVSKYKSSAEGGENQIVEKTRVKFAGSTVNLNAECVTRAVYVWTQKGVDLFKNRDEVASIYYPRVLEGLDGKEPEVNVNILAKHVTFLKQYKECFSRYFEKEFIIEKGYHTLKRPNGDMESEGEELKRRQGKR